MTLGQHIGLLRKKKDLSQAELGKRVKTSGDIIGRYERDEINPSIEVVIKIADVLEVSIDFLVGRTSVVMDKATMKRLQDIGKLSEADRTFVLQALDALIRDAKTKRAYS